MKRIKKKKHIPPFALAGIAVALCITGVLFISEDEHLSDMLKTFTENPSFYLSIVGMELQLLPNNTETTSSNEHDFSYVQTESHFLPEEFPQSTSKVPVSEITLEESSSSVGNTGVYINNETSYEIDVTNMLNNPILPTITDDTPEILIVHTHGSEAFTPDDEFMYVPDDNDRSLNTDFNIIRVGNEMEKVFEDNGFIVYHIEDIFDSPTYSGSYSRSLEAITEKIKEHPTIDMVIDVHRDALIATNGTKYKPVSEVDGEKVAQLMMVIGSNEGGLTHDNFMDNLNFAVNLQNHINKNYPTLMRPINLRQERFNQHSTGASIILEVGASGNSLGEAIAAAQIFAEELSLFLD